MSDADAFQKQLAAQFALGRAEAAEKRAKELAEARALEERHAQDAIERAARADVWARAEFPALARAAAAKGDSKISVDEARAVALRKLGLRVEETWVEGWYDEGVRFGDHWRYKAILP